MHFSKRQAGATWPLLKPGRSAWEQESKNPVPYPDPAVHKVMTLDSEMSHHQRGGRACTRVLDQAEGPVWIGDGGYLLFSDIPNNRMLRWLEETGEVTVYRSPSNYSNGTSLNCAWGGSSRASTTPAA